MLTYVQRRAHEGGPVMVMISGHSADGTPFVISGGADGRVRRWEANAASNLKPQVCSVCMFVCMLGVRIACTDPDADAIFETFMS